MMNLEINALLNSTQALSDISDKAVSIPSVTSEIESSSLRLSEIMGNQPVTPVSSVPLMDGSTSVTRTMGDVIIAHLDSVGSNFTSHLDKFHNLVHKVPNELNLPVFIEMQVQMAAISLHVELIGKCVSKGTQDVDQLCKLQ
jgi:hypothetical protein